MDKILKHLKGDGVIWIITLIMLAFSLVSVYSFVPILIKVEGGTPFNFFDTGELFSKFNLLSKGNQNKMVIENTDGKTKLLADKYGEFVGLTEENKRKLNYEIIYPELMEKKDTFSLATGYSVYDNGDFSEVHFDGINPGRACVLIMYFADPSTYQEGDGGELFLGHNIKTNEKQILEFANPFEKCPPVYGNYAIMDFTKYNVGHSIEMVKNNFRRFALQSFVGP